MLEINTEVAKLMDIADEMASAAASFNSQQGYDNFIRARSRFESSVKYICSKCKNK